MRVITGTARGVRLEALPGEATRPTTDRVKESIFNIVQFDIIGRRVLDLFAGSGQMGIEALSRGAAHAIFVDNAQGAVKVIRENLSKTKLSHLSSVKLDDYKHFLKNQGDKFDLVFLDPPYGQMHIPKCLELFDRFDIINIGGIIVCESDVEDKLPEITGNIAQRREYIYGRVKITVYIRHQVNNIEKDSDLSGEL